MLNLSQLVINHQSTIIQIIHDNKKTHTQKHDILSKAIILDKL